MKTKILIIGVGSIGARHLRNLLALGARGIALCDSSREKLEAASKLGDFRVHKSVRQALVAEQPDIVFVCNPTHLHVPTALLALKAGAHVFIEKPVSHTRTGIDTLMKEAEKRKRVVMVACNFRFHEGFKRLQTVLRKRTFGAPLLARVALGYFLPDARKHASYKKVYAAGTRGGGALLDSGYHAADYLSALFGKIQQSVMMKGKTRSLKIQSEEAAALIFRHENSLLSSVSLDYLSRKAIHRIEVVTDTGVLTLDILRNTLIFEDKKNLRTMYAGTKNMNAMFLKELKHFLTCVRQGKKPLQDLHDAKRVLNVLSSNHEN